MRLYINIKNILISLSIELIEFKDIFSIEEVGKLSLENNNSYIIKTITKPSYSPLYNLLYNKLEILRSYLDNTLIKG